MFLCLYPCKSQVKGCCLNTLSNIFQCRVPPQKPPSFAAYILLFSACILFLFQNIFAGRFVALRKSLYLCRRIKQKVFVMQTKNNFSSSVSFNIFYLAEPNKSVTHTHTHTHILTTV